MCAKSTDRKKKVKINLDVIKSAKATGKRYYIWDNKIEGFMIVVQATGNKTYCLNYYDETNRERRLKIGTTREFTPDQARKKAEDLRARINKGENPAEQKHKTNVEPTFNEIADKFLEEYAKVHKVKSCKNDISYLDNHLKPFFGKKKISKINKNDVQQFHLKKIGQKPTANNCVQVLSKIMNLCEQWGFRAENTNPCYGLKRYPANKVENFFTPDEIKKLMVTIDKLEAEGKERPYEMALFRILLLSGHRLNEIMALERKQLVRERNAAFWQDTKTGKREIPLCEKCFVLIDALEPDPNDKTNDHIFLSSRKSKTGYMWRPIKAWKRVLKAAELRYIRIHDLRHTNASLAAAAGVPIQVVQKRLGHSQIQTTMRYAHLYDDPVRQSSEMISSTIDNITNPNKNVREFPKLQAVS